METIVIEVERGDVYREVGKATDYTGSKMVDGGDDVRERVLAGDEELEDLGRMWDEAVLGVNEQFKSMVRAWSNEGGRYRVELEVSRGFDKGLRGNVEGCVRGYFIASIVGQWFKYSNKGEVGDYLGQAGEMLLGAERLLYSRRRPVRPGGGGRIKN